MLINFSNYIIGLLITIIISLIWYIVRTWKRESILSAENNHLTIERTKTEKEANELREEIVTLKKEKANLISKRNIRDKYVFNDKYGIYKSLENEQCFCASCMSKDIESPMRTEEYGWKCMSKDCLVFIPNEKYKPTKRSRIISKGIDINDY